MNEFIVDVVLPRDSFGLGWWLESNVEPLVMETVIAGDSCDQLLLWVDTELDATFLLDAKAHEDVVDVDHLCVVGDWSLFSVELRAGTTQPVLMAAVESTFSQAVGTSTGWYSRLVFESESAYDAFETACERVGVDVVRYATWEGTSLPHVERSWA